MGSFCFTGWEWDSWNHRVHLVYSARPTWPISWNLVGSFMPYSWHWGTSHDCMEEWRPLPHHIFPKKKGRGNTKLSPHSHNPLRPLQLNTLFLGPDRSYFWRKLLLVLRSEVSFNYILSMCNRFLKKRLDYWPRICQIYFVYKLTYRPFPEERPARQTEY